MLEFPAGPPDELPPHADSAQTALSSVNEIRNAAEGIEHFLQVGPALRE
jgi:hypothetical protein